WGCTYNASTRAIRSASDEWRPRDSTPPSTSARRDRRFPTENTDCVHRLRGVTGGATSARAVGPPRGQPSSEGREARDEGIGRSALGFGGRARPWCAAPALA